MSGNTTGRPRGDVRKALSLWAKEHRDTVAAGLTFRDLVHQVPGMSANSPGDLRMVRLTLQAMAKAGELRRVGHARVEGACRPATLYAPTESRPLVDAAMQLQGLMTALVCRTAGGTTGGMESNLPDR